MTKKMINCTHLQLLTQVRRQAAGQWDQDEEEVTYIKYFLSLEIFPAGDGVCGPGGGGAGGGEDLHPRAGGAGAAGQLAPGRPGHRQHLLSRGQVSVTQDNSPVTVFMIESIVQSGA